MNVPGGTARLFFNGDQAIVFYPTPFSWYTGWMTIAMAGPTKGGMGLAPTLFGGQELKGEFRLVTVFARTGLITTNEYPPFDTPATGPSGTSYNPNVPFLQA